MYLHVESVMKCPGQDTRYWKPGDIFEAACPSCGALVEFFKDESTRRCKNCGQLAVNPKMDFGCAAYCKYAEECLGELGPDIVKKRDDLLKDRVAIEVKRRLNRDFRRIARTMKAARYADEIGRTEKADLPVVLSAAYLAEIGATAGGADEVRAILIGLGARAELVDEVIAVIGEATSGTPDSRSKNGRIVAEAYALARLDEGDHDPAVLNILGTETGKGLAQKILSKGETA